MRSRLLPAILFLITAAHALAASAVDLTGQVLDEERIPISKAHVYIYTAAPRVGIATICSSCYRDCGKSVAAASNGRFVLRGLDRTLIFNVLAVADGYEPKMVSGVDPQKGAILAVLKRRSLADADRLVRGRVVDEKGKPQVGALVTPQAVRWGDRTGYGAIPGVDRLSVTDSKGDFALRVPERVTKLDVKVLARNFAPEIGRYLEPGKRGLVTVRPGAAIRGRVVRNGKPVAGTAVAFVQSSRWSETFIGVPDDIGTDRNGEFLFTGVAPGQQYHVFVKTEGRSNMAAAAKPVDVGSEGSTADAGTFVLEKGHRISGRISGPDGAVPAGTVVTLSREAAFEVITVKPKTDGTFTFEGVTPDRALMSARADGFVISPDSTSWDPKMNMVAVVASADVDGLHLILKPEDEGPVPSRRP